ncbi:MAG: 30S ribosomal protein S8 [Planctomycetota bacterium]
MWSDPVADMLTRIRNAVTNRRKEVVIPASCLKAAIAKVLQGEGYINSFDQIEDGLQGRLRIQLKYGVRGETVLHKLQRESTPGCRVYKKFADLPRVLDGMGVCIVSTSRGVMSDRQCREEKLGGELLCTVY